MGVSCLLLCLYGLNFAEQFADLLINIDVPPPQDIFQNLDRPHHSTYFSCCNTGRFLSAIDNTFFGHVPYPVFEGALRTLRLPCKLMVP